MCLKHHTLFHIYLERMCFFLQREEYQCVNPEQKDTANGQSPKRCSQVCLMLEQSRQSRLICALPLYIVYDFILKNC